MALKEHIDGIRKRLEQNIFKSETAVRQGIVDPLLRSLGWPTDDTLIVFPEYPVGSGRVDYALCHPSLTPRVFIEAKQVSNIKGAEEQLFGYDSRIRVPIAVLTDGREWQFFHPTGEGTWAERKVCEFDLITGDSQENAERVNRYLNYGSIRTDEAVGTIKKDYEEIVQQRLVETRLPEVWNELVQEKNEDLLLIVMDAAKSKIGYEPTEEQILDFFEGLERKTKSEPIAVGTRQKRSFPPNPQQGMTKSSQPPLRVIMSDGDIAYRKATDTFCEVIEKIGIEKVKSLELILCSIPLIASDWEGTYQQKHRSKCGNYFITTHGSVATLAKKLKEIDRKLRVNMTVEIFDKS